MVSYTRAMTLIRIPFYFSLLCSLFCYSLAAQAPADLKLRADAEDKIREVVLRKQMMEWAESGDNNEREAKTKMDKEIAHHLNFRIFFIEVEQKDPTEAFLKRFSDVPRIIKGVSASAVDKKWRMAVVDKRTREPAITFYVGKVHWTGENSAEVEGGYHCDGLCAAGITFSVELKDGNWTVVREKMGWIS